MQLNGNLFNHSRSSANCFYLRFFWDFYGGETNRCRTILAQGQKDATDLQEATDAPNDGEFPVYDREDTKAQRKRKIFVS